MFCRVLSVGLSVLNKQGSERASCLLSTPKYEHGKDRCKAWSSTGVLSSWGPVSLAFWEFWPLYTVLNKPCWLDSGAICGFIFSISAFLPGKFEGHNHPVSLCSEIARVLAEHPLTMLRAVSWPTASCFGSGIRNLSIRPRLIVEDRVGMESWGPFGHQSELLLSFKCGSCDDRAPPLGFVVFQFSPSVCGTAVCLSKHDR
jgi:hypothetical protein